MIRNRDVEMVLSMSLNRGRGNRLSISRHSARAQVRRVVNAPVVSNQVLPMLYFAQRERGHDSIVAELLLPPYRRGVAGMYPKNEALCEGRRGAWDLG